jgi:hypothetical protein
MMLDSIPTDLYVNVNFAGACMSPLERRAAFGAPIEIADEVIDVGGLLAHDRLGDRHVVEAGGPHPGHPIVAPHLGCPGGSSRRHPV